MIQELSLRLMSESFTLSKLPQFADMPTIIARGEYCFICRTDDEFSIICPDFMAPSNVQQDDGWRAFKIEEPINYMSTGIIAMITTPLSQANIPVLTITSHSSCFFFVKDANLIEATKALQHAGIKFIHPK